MKPVKKQINQKICLILIALFLTACSSIENLVDSAATTSPMINTKLSPTPTLQPLDPSLTPFPTTKFHGPIIKACVTPNNDAKNISAKGTLFFETFDIANFERKSFLYNFDQKKINTFLDNKDLAHLIGVSPDRKKLLYSYEYGGDRSVALANSQGKFIQQFAYRASDNVYFDNFSWLNADTLRAIDVASDMLSFQVYAYKPETSYYEELRTKWPNAYVGNQLDWNVDAWSLWSLTRTGANVVGANIVYDPTMSRIVYPKNDETISLRDVKSGKELASMKLPRWGRIPRWSDDGSNLVLVGNIDKNTFGIKSINGAMPKASRNEEFFIVNRDGSQFQQLTNLTDSTSHISIDEYAWSPDGRTIAFWLNTSITTATLDGKTSKLMLLDIRTGTTTNLCIQGISGRFNLKADGIHMIHPQPIWSPDGSQILITQLNPQDNKQFDVLVVDIASKSAYKIAENLEPVGWMTKEP